MKLDALARATTTELVPVALDSARFDRIMAGR